MSDSKCIQVQEVDKDLFDKSFNIWKFKIDDEGKLPNKKKTRSDYVRFLVKNHADSK